MAKKNERIEENFEEIGENFEKNSSFYTVSKSRHLLIVRNHA